VSPPPRAAVRALLLDPSDRLLLLSGRDPSRPDGGGLDAGEAPEVALRREIAEEVGIHDVRVGPAVWLLRNRFVFNGRAIDQENTFYVVRTGETAIDRSGQDQVEQASITGARWWTLDELRATPDQLYPVPLEPGLTALLRDGPPTSPIRLPDE
jgi:8-oxo-dGTP pyrophosphatase MutT (NUDIX family)